MAGQSMRDIKRRIRSVKNTQQITKAMEMVAAAKLRRSQQQVEAARPFAEKLHTVLTRLARSQAEAAKPIEHPLLEVREVNRVAYVLVTADRGLAGGYNANIIRRASQAYQAEEREKALITVGRKGRDYFVRRGVTPYSEYSQLGDEIDFTEARRIAQELISAYESKAFDEIHLIYTAFVSAGVQRPTTTRLLPLETPAGDEAGSQTADSASGDGEALEYIYEPNPEAVLRILIPRYLETQVYRVLMEAKASELGARMVAMRNASDNAQEMIGELTLSFNRARQASITKELSEIVGGANALAGGD